jgi:hypothetical protein
MINGILISMFKLSLLLFLLVLIGSTTALGYVRPEKECVEPTVPVLYLDRWTKRSCNGMNLTIDEMVFRGSGVPIYGHTLNVPLGYEVLIIKEPLFGVPRETLYHERTHRFVSFFFWDTPIEEIRVSRLKKIEKNEGL